MARWDWNSEWESLLSPINRVRAYAANNGTPPLGIKIDFCDLTGNLIMSTPKGILDVA